MTKIIFIGCGNIGKSLLNSILKTTAKEDIIIFTKSKNSRDSFICAGFESYDSEDLKIKNLGEKLKSESTKSTNQIFSKL